MKSTPIYPQPINRFFDMYWPTDQESMIRAVENYFKIAVGTNGTDKHGTVIHTFEPFEPENPQHLEAIFKRDLEAYCHKYDLKPDKTYVIDFVQAYTAKWETRLEAIKHPGVKAIIRSYISYLEAQKAPEMARSESLRRKLTESGFIGETDPATFFNVMKFHQLPGDSKPFLWRGSKADAMFFFIKAGLSTSDANKCFRTADEKPFRDSYYPKNDHNQRKKFADILPLLP